MELPHLGDHCAQAGCNKLDYLPITCSLCNKKYCTDHHRYEDHNCPESYKLDVQVPICPLCEKPVPSKRGLTPDLAVNEHLENNCQSKSKKIYNNKCSVPGCKVKELISIQCDSCTLNYCLRHRHTSDHDCKRPSVAIRERVLGGSIFTNWVNGSSSSSGGSSTSSKSLKKEPSNKNKCIPSVKKSNAVKPNAVLQVSPTVRDANVSIFQGNLSEAEALRKALLTSQGAEAPAAEGEAKSEDADADLAMAIALSLDMEGGRQPPPPPPKKSSGCSLS